MILPITKKQNPVQRMGKTLYDLCFLYPKHKEDIPNRKLNIKNTHSNISVTNNDKLKIGMINKIKGIREQCIAHRIDALIPILSNLFIILNFLLLCRKLFDSNLLLNYFQH